MSRFAVFGTDMFGEEIRAGRRAPVLDRFTFPPFSVFDARSGDWQERKRAWLSLGIRGEVGRDAPAIHCPTSSSEDRLDDANYTSVFDPVLTELAYNWFCPKGGTICDPFAGGSVRGIVAGMLGFDYWGCDLRQEQIDANKSQSDIILPPKVPNWVCGDSMQTLARAPNCDFVFSCPPYGDLEKYSDDPNDLSRMEWHAFCAAYRRIILRSCARLKDNSFACFVVGDFRDQKGFYRGFVQETITAFEQCGAKLYNEGVLVTPVGSASMRVSRQFSASRKFAKTHQNVLVFCKGDWRAASDKINAMLNAA